MGKQFRVTDLDGLADSLREGACLPYGPFTAKFNSTCGERIVDDDEDDSS